jgi:hypothetical protein
MALWATYADIAKKEIVKYFQKIFNNLSTIQNDGIKTLDFTGSKVQVTENYAYRGEKYPVIVVSAEGGQMLVRGFNDDIGRHYMEEVLGSHNNTYAVVGKNRGGAVSSAAVKFTPTEDFGLEQISLTMANNGIFSQGDITFNLYEGGVAPGSGSLLASGTVGGFISTDFSTKYLGFGADIDLVTTSSYWIEVVSDDESGYAVCIDTSDNAEGKTLALKDDTDSAWVVSDDMAIVMSLRGDTQDMLGGDVRVPIVLQIAAKDIQTVDNIFDMVLLWAELAKRFEYSDFIDKRIKIESISFGGDTAPRELGGNITIYVKQVTLNIVGAWTYGIDKEVLASLGYSVTTF